MRGSFRGAYVVESRWLEGNSGNGKGGMKKFGSGVSALVAMALSLSSNSAWSQDFPHESVSYYSGPLRVDMALALDEFHLDDGGKRHPPTTPYSRITALAPNYRH